MEQLPATEALEKRRLLGKKRARTSTLLSISNPILSSQSNTLRCDTSQLALDAVVIEDEFPTFPVIKWCFDDEIDSQNEPEIEILLEENRGLRKMKSLIGERGRDVPRGMVRSRAIAERLSHLDPSPACDAEIIKVSKRLRRTFVTNDCLTKVVPSFNSLLTRN